MSTRNYYSVPAFAISSLFGGPLAAIAFATIEARALGRLRRDLPWIAGGLIVVVLAALAAADYGLLDRAIRDLGTQHLPTWEHLVYRLAALGFFAVFWVLHGYDRRALATAGVRPVAGYGAGLIALMVGLVGGTALLLALR